MLTHVLVRQQEYQQLLHVMQQLNLQQQQEAAAAEAAPVADAPAGDDFRIQAAYMANGVLMPSSGNAATAMVRG